MYGYDKVLIPHSAKSTINRYLVAILGSSKEGSRYTITAILNN